jgi:hypothetical protein
MTQTTPLFECNLDQLELTRSVLLQHIAASQTVPEFLAEHARRYRAVTHWEELLCATFDAEAGWLRAMVALYRQDGYSGLYRLHGSIEYLRFFIDWQDGAGYQPNGLAHFKVCDCRSDNGSPGITRYRRVSISFDRERYWGCVMNGLSPVVKGVLSWHEVPALDPDFTPRFGNTVASSRCVDSEEALIEQAAVKQRVPGDSQWYAPGIGMLQ